MLSPSEVALGPVVARVLIHELPRTEELAKRRRARSVDHAGLEEHRAWYVLATRGLVVKHADAAELRVVAAAVLAVAASAVLVAKIPSKLGTNMVAVLAPACAQSRVKKQPRGGENAV